MKRTRYLLTLLGIALVLGSASLLGSCDRVATTVVPAPKQQDESSATGAEAGTADQANQGVQFKREKEAELLGE